MPNTAPCSRLQCDWLIVVTKSCLFLKSFKRPGSGNSENSFPLYFSTFYLLRENAEALL